LGGDINPPFGLPNRGSERITDYIPKVRRTAF
jgi:hypothetical protein